MQGNQSTSLCDIKYKLVFLGEMGVGKSSIIERFIKNRFDQRHNQTVGIDFLARNIDYNGSKYRMQLWDTAGQQRYKSLIPAYLRDANCAIFVYDITRQQTFSEISTWIQLFRQNQPLDSISILVGNKTDLKQNRVVSKQVGQLFATKMNFGYCEVSAKTGCRVEDLFHSIIDNIAISKKQSNNVGSAQSIYRNRSESRINKRSVIEVTKKQERFACCYI